MPGNVFRLAEVASDRVSLLTGEVDFFNGPLMGQWPERMAQPRVAETAQSRLGPAVNWSRSFGFRSRFLAALSETIRVPSHGRVLLVSVRNVVLPTQVSLALHASNRHTACWIPL